MFLIIPFNPFVQQRIQDNQKRHVNHKQRNHPNHYYNNHFNNCRVAVFVFALASRTEDLFLSLELIPNLGQNDPIASTTKERCVMILRPIFLSYLPDVGRYVRDVHDSSCMRRVRTVYYGCYARANAFASYVVVRLGLKTTIL